MIVVGSIRADSTRSAPASSSMNDSSADVSSSQGRVPPPSAAPGSLGASVTIAIGLTLGQQAFGETLSATPSAERPQGIVGYGDDPDGLAVVQPDEMNVAVNVVALANGRRNDGLTTFGDRSLQDAPPDSNSTRRFCVMQVFQVM